MPHFSAHNQLVFLPDGSKFWLIFDAISSQIVVNDEARVITGSADSIDSKKQTWLKNRGFIQHNTQFFTASPLLQSQLRASNPSFHWQNTHAPYFSYFHVTAQSSTDVDSVRQLMLGSFAELPKKIIRTIHRKIKPKSTLKNLKLKTFLRHLLLV